MRKAEKYKKTAFASKPGILFFSHFAVMISFVNRDKTGSITLYMEEPFLPFWQTKTLISHWQEAS